MTKLNLSRAQIEVFAAPLLACLRAGVAVDAATSLVVHFRVPVALKYQSVQLAPGLDGRVSSDDGKQVTVNGQDVLAWLGLA